MITKEELEYRAENGIDTTVYWIENNRTYEGRADQYIIECTDVCFGNGYIRFIKMEYLKVLQFHNGEFCRFNPSDLSFVYDVINHKADDLYKVWEGLQ